MLAVIDTGTDYRAWENPPIAVGSHCELSAVLILDLELGDEADVAPENVPEPPVPAEAATVPAVAKPGTEDVFARCQQVGYVVCGVFEAGPVNRPSRSHRLLADPMAVELYLVEPVGGDVEPGFGGLVPEGEASPDKSRAPGIRVLVSSNLGPPAPPPNQLAPISPLPPWPDGSRRTVPPGSPTRGPGPPPCPESQGFARPRDEYRLGRRHRPGPGHEARPGAPRSRRRVCAHPSSAAVFQESRGRRSPIPRARRWCRMSGHLGSGGTNNSFPSVGPGQRDRSGRANVWLRG